MTHPREPERVRGMFGAIARRYDLLNHVLSANLDRSWRRAAVRALPDGGLDRVLDLCGGTGDLTVELARNGRGSRVVCADFSHPMLLVAQRKFGRLGIERRCALLEADGLGLPFRDSVFDAVTVGFGVRNFVDLDAGLREIHRVLRAGGAMVVLEFGRPTAPVLAQAYSLYLKHLLPRLGGGIARERGAYSYLARTISLFPDAEGLAQRILACGFDDCDWTTRTGGIVAIHTARKAREVSCP
jgi:demethylmenaquinone methyltransferase/2-methoxy-6-polyprenyl-1,4-benzoquinol methylase